MRPAKPDAAAQADMFRETLEAILDPGHELLGNCSPPWHFGLI